MNTAVAALTRKYGGGRVTAVPRCCCGYLGRHQRSTTPFLSRGASSSSPSPGGNESPEEAKIRKNESNESAEGGERGRGGRRSRLSQHHFPRESWKELRQLMGEPLQKPAGALLGPDIYHSDDDDDDDDDGKISKPAYIPEVSLYEGEGRTKKRILVLCTGGTLTMAPDPKQNGALAPVQGALSHHMSKMEELNSPNLPFEYTLFEYTPFRDSSDLGPADWATLAQDIKVRRAPTTACFAKRSTASCRLWCGKSLTRVLEMSTERSGYSCCNVPILTPLTKLFFRT